MMPSVREMAIMFLGGPLDHTTRRVIRSVIAPGRPAAPRYRASLADGTTADYNVHEIDIEGMPRWWVYILEGYAPPRQHILNTNPN